MKGLYPPMVIRHTKQRRKMRSGHSTTKGVQSMKRHIFLFQLAAAICFLYSTVVSGQAATEFLGSLDTVTITDSAGTNTPPTASFTYRQNGTSFTFDASSSSDPDGNIAEFKWDFGNGTTGSGASTTSQLTPGSYPVTLTVTDNAGGVAITQSTVTYFEGVVIEDAEDGSIARWTIVNTDTPGEIINEVDPETGSRVIRFAGDLKSQYLINLVPDDSTLSFEMKFNEHYQIMIQTLTTLGNRYFYLYPEDTDRLGTGINIFLGLGSNSTTGNWQSISINLKEILSKAQPNNSLQKVFLIRFIGNGSVDNIISN